MRRLCHGSCVAAAADRPIPAKRCRAPIERFKSLRQKLVKHEQPHLSAISPDYLFLYFRQYDARARRSRLLRAAERVTMLILSAMRWPCRALIALFAEFSLDARDWVERDGMGEEYTSRACTEPGKYRAVTPQWPAKRIEFTHATCRCTVMDALTHREMIRGKRCGRVIGDMLRRHDFCSRTLRKEMSRRGRGSARIAVSMMITAMGMARTPPPPHWAASARRRHIDRRATPLLFPQDDASLS